MDLPSVVVMKTLLKIVKKTYKKTVKKDRFFVFWLSFIIPFPLKQSPFGVFKDDNCAKSPNRKGLR